MFIKKHEKFGIRKYKLGAASVLLGTCLAIDLSASGEAKASETTNEETKIDSNI
ncbi:MSCRAMM family adhesin SdrC [Staphylococcus xylosus]|uniref:YSIRK-type signal peptide-containing protein n=1 Tax=Staphylococcus xylosus TaxID=1288 RepID=UPI002DB84E37|nr:YSIRK-type signal peptide-containing protein [Staphylococcus xylosus]MEB6321962.1 MSCRAMM family adhesin SdrC [Staphylococcus xylosus]